MEAKPSTPTLEENRALIKKLASGRHGEGLADSPVTESWKHVFPPGDNSESLKAGLARIPELNAAQARLTAEISAKERADFDAAHQPPKLTPEQQAAAAESAAHGAQWVYAATGYVRRPTAHPPSLPEVPADLP